VSKNAFREAFDDDVRDTYMDDDSEFVSWRDFAFKSQSNTYTVRRLKVIWNHDVLKHMSASVMYGQLMVGDVLLLTKIVDWDQRPRRGQIIWTPRDTPWTILNCQEIFRTLYRISLQAVESTA
jgi:hypothetical protein